MFLTPLSRRSNENMMLNRRACRIFDSANRDQKTEFVQHCETGVIVGMARKGQDFIEHIEEHNHGLFWFLIWFKLVFGGRSAAGNISI
jgi:hypothetical protein